MPSLRLLRQKLAIKLCLVFAHTPARISRKQKTTTMRSGKKIFAAASASIHKQRQVLDDKYDDLTESGTNPECASEKGEKKAKKAIEKAETAAAKPKKPTTKKQKAGKTNQIIIDEIDDGVPMLGFTGDAFLNFAGHPADPIQALSGIPFHDLRSR